MSLERAMMDIMTAEHSALSVLCARMGYPEVMRKVSQIWQAHAGADAQAVGPQVKYCRPCPHPEGTDEVCEWCGNSGWVTHRAYRAMLELELVEAEKEEAKDEN